ncbi:hypothetical protein [Pengzhenrongella sp.]|jgi:hypothetical protein|uniref:hypothetical protein n=1 Tax=Pengzhenrongella sp. TaxID=2888820 RepID=UPI002F91EA34
MATSSAPKVSLADRALAPHDVPLPRPEHGLVWRPLVLDDVPALAVLVAQCEEFDAASPRT